MNAPTNPALLRAVLNAPSQPASPTVTDEFSPRFPGYSVIDGIAKIKVDVLRNLKSSNTEAIDEWLREQDETVMGVLILMCCDDAASDANIGWTLRRMILGKVETMAREQAEQVRQDLEDDDAARADEFERTHGRRPG